MLEDFSNCSFLPPTDETLSLALGEDASESRLEEIVPAALTLA